MIYDLPNAVAMEIWENQSQNLELGIILKTFTNIFFHLTLKVGVFAGYTSVMLCFLLIKCRYFIPENLLFLILVIQRVPLKCITLAAKFVEWPVFQLNFGIKGQFYKGIIGK